MGEIEKAEPFIREKGYATTLGRLSLAKADYLSAEKYYEKSIGLAQRSRNVALLFIAYTGVASASEKMGEDKKAEEYYLKAVTVTEDLRSNLFRSQRETFFDARIYGFLRTAPYDGLARVKLRTNKPVQAFKDSEYIKARTFAEAMSKRSESTNFDVPANILAKDKELNDEVAVISKDLQSAYKNQDQERISRREHQLKKAKQKLSAHLDMLRKQYPLFAATKYPEPMDLNQTALKENEWVLAYHVTDPGIIIYLTEGKKIVKALFKPILRAELEKLVQDFRKPLSLAFAVSEDVSQKSRSFDLQTARKLADLLLSDVLESLPTHAPLIVVPDDSLGTLPFEMLVLNDKGSVKTDKDLPYVSGAQFFGDRNPISYSQSVTALTLSRIYAKSKPSEPGLLVLADPVFQDKDERMARAPKNEAPKGPFASLLKRLGLMAAEKDGLMGCLTFKRLALTGELAQTLAAMENKNVKICQGFEASKENFLRNISHSLIRYNKVVFATHGYFGKDLPGIMEPVLVLTLVPTGTDGYLRMSEIMSLKMNADIVALTACQTGLGKRTAGEGTMGMGRAFQYAGAKSVLMSLWSVSEVTSVRLVKSFLQHMKEGKTKLEALLLARDEIRKQGFDHPFFWAGFILVGETD